MILFQSHWTFPGADTHIYLHGPETDRTTLAKPLTQQIVNAVHGWVEHPGGRGLARPAEAIGFQLPKQT
jgi:hypothetical protein